MISAVMPHPPRWLPVRIVLAGMLAAGCLALLTGGGFFSAWTGMTDAAVIARSWRSLIILAVALATATSTGFTVTWIAEFGGRRASAGVRFLGRAVAVFPIAALAWALTGWWIGRLGWPVETLMPMQLTADIQDWRMVFGSKLWEYLAPALVLAIPLTGEVIGSAEVPLRARLQSICLLAPAWLILVEDALHFMGWGGWMAQSIRAGDAQAVAIGLAAAAWFTGILCTLANAIPTGKRLGAGPFVTFCWLPWPLWVLTASVCIASQKTLWLLLWLSLAAMTLLGCLALLRRLRPAQQACRIAAWSLEVLSLLPVWLAALAALHPQPLTGGIMRLFRPLLVTTPEQAAQTLAHPEDILRTGAILVGVSLVLHLLSQMLLRAAPAAPHVPEEESSAA